MPEISVIVVNWNGKHFLETCLSALRQQIFRDFEIILVDNGSQDGSAEYVRSNFSEVRLLALSENRGFTGGNIAGWEQSRGDLIILLNNDTEADPHWLDEIHKANLEFPQMGSFASKMLLFDQRDRIDNCGFDLTVLGLPIDRGRGETDGPAWAVAAKVFGACGGAATYRRSMLEDVGFLDNDFFMTFEDVDLAFRCQLRGYECMLVPGAIVYHYYRATMAKYPARQSFFSQRNIELVYLKNMPLGLIVRSLPQRLLYQLGGVIFCLKQGVGLSVLKAKLDAIRQLPRSISKRRTILNRRTIRDDQLRSLLRRDWLAAKWKRLLSARRRPTEAALQTSRSPSLESESPRGIACDPRAAAGIGKR
jgi:GT2 family glycosyltransferase